MREAKIRTLIVLQFRSKGLVNFDIEKKTVSFEAYFGKPIFPKQNYIYLLSSHCSLIKAG